MNTCVLKSVCCLTGKIICGIFFASALSVQPVQADALIGAKIAWMDLDMSSTEDPVNAAIYAGYEFDSLIADLSLIGEVSRTFESGQAGNGDDLDFEAESAYVLWKTTRSVFVTVRGGFVQYKIISGATSHRDDGVLLGAGVGVAIGRTRLQIEYTKLAGDADYIGIGLEI